jgi:hypothetical protein
MCFSEAQGVIYQNEARFLRFPTVLSILHRFEVLVELESNVNKKPLKKGGGLNP